jgi:hypothetical protein
MHKVLFHSFIHTTIYEFYLLFLWPIASYICTMSTQPAVSSFSKIKCFCPASQTHQPITTPRCVVVVNAAVVGLAPGANPMNDRELQRKRSM